MRLLGSVVLLSAVITTLTASYKKGVEASTWEEEGNGDLVDAADFDFEDDFAAAPSLTELAKQGREQQKKIYEQEEPERDEPFAVDDEEAEGTVKEQIAASAEEQDIDPLDSPDDLEEGEEDKQQKKAPGSAAGEPDSTPVASPQAPTKYDGQVVQTKDEEGTELDISSLNHQDEHIAPTITEFVDVIPTFKKEEEEKKKKKEEAKKRKEANNDIEVYEREIKAFNETQEKNKARFKDEVENAEKDLQPPKNPGWWRRLKHWYEVKVAKLVDKYGSDLRD